MRGEHTRSCLMNGNKIFLLKMLQAGSPCRQCTQLSLLGARQHLRRFPLLLQSRTIQHVINFPEPTLPPSPPYRLRLRSSRPRSTSRRWRRAQAGEGLVVRSQIRRAVLLASSKRTRHLSTRPLLLRRVRWLESESFRRWVLEAREAKDALSGRHRFSCTTGQRPR